MFNLANVCKVILEKLRKYDLCLYTYIIKSFPVLSHKQKINKNATNNKSAL